MNKLFTIILLVIFTSCITEKPQTINITDVEAIHRNDFSSASGVVFDANQTLVVGDDIPYLLFLNQDLKITDSIIISPDDSIKKGRLPWYLKPDYEALEITNFLGNKHAIIIPSGSDSITRDTAIMICLSTNNIIKKNIRPLYSTIKQQAGFAANREINIEGIAISDSHTYLFHRGNLTGNIIIEIKLEAFIDYLQSKTEIPSFNTYRFDLPSHHNVASGFSGATMLPDNSAILFTASMEDMKDETSDGEVLGSYIGIIPVENMEKGKCITTILTKDKKILPKKIEGITINKQLNNNTYMITTVCDNDDGTSDIIKFNMEIK